MNLHYSIIICTFLCLLLCKNGSSLSLESLVSCNDQTYPEAFNIVFYFSKKGRPDQSYTLNSNVNLKSFNFDPKRRTAIIIHGFKSSHNKDNIEGIKQAFLDERNMNVIRINWQKGCDSLLDYKQAAANTQSASTEIVNFVHQLKKSFPNESRWGDFHFVGHSLGAHVASQAATILNHFEIIYIPRVTGLDPALPCFRDVNSPLRLNKSSANFVDVIHTNGDGYGIWEPMGHVDFYVNGGKIQHGCSLSWSYLPCHHTLAIDYFTESLIQKKLNKCQFWAEPWDRTSDKKCNKQCPRNECQKKNNCLKMGIDARKVSSGLTTFYVSTTTKAPYCNKC